ncbi:MAG: transglutaminase domain-containing protein [Clostridia bacterium]|nr:transglutaminase domain-containing protein [Clostridia bacterium]
MKRNEKLLILSILGIMVSAVAIYCYDKLDENGYSVSDVGDMVMEQVKNFNSDRSDIYDDNKIIENTTSSKYQKSGSFKVTAGYKSLGNQAERLCYKYIIQSAEKISDNVNDSGLYDIDPVTVKNYVMDSYQIKKVLYAVQHDHPEIFWISSAFSYYTDKNSTTLKLSSTFSKSDWQSAANELNKKVFNILAKIPSGYTEYEKEMFIHNYVVENCAYASRQTKDPKVFTSYGCLVENQAVCEGYSKAVQLLMCAAGIECRTIQGSRGNETHMWNLARINGEWYHVDATWNGKEQVNRYSYFNISDETVKKDHKIAISASENPDGYFKNQYYNFALPACTSLKDNYFEQNAVKINKSDDLKNDTIVRKLSEIKTKRENIIYIKIADNIGLEKAKSILFSNNSNVFFDHIKNANKSTKSGNPLNTSQIEYTECKPQNVLAVKLF